MADIGGDEKRQHDRVDINVELQCIEDYIAEYVISLSQGGVFIRSKKPLALGTKVTLKFSVILDDVETVDGEGEVVRVETAPGNTGMGVAFTKLTAESKELIDELFARAAAAAAK
ncbi:MAG: PilZ domain-containing protein [Bradymonadaceae bacterium]|nr:PilZ domain-containing protein [Lujinxingiaceae bacterium]